PITTSRPWARKYSANKTNSLYVGTSRQSRIPMRGAARPPRPPRPPPPPPPPRPPPPPWPLGPYKAFSTPWRAGAGGAPKRREDPPLTGRGGHTPASAAL